MNILAKMVLPLVKGFIIKQLKDEEFQTQLVTKITEKVDFPKVTKDQETKFINEVYDATQELLIEFVKNM